MFAVMIFNDWELFDQVRNISKNSKKYFRSKYQRFGRQITLFCRDVHHDWSEKAFLYLQLIICFLYEQQFLEYAFCYSLLDFSLTSLVPDGLNVEVYFIIQLLLL